MRSSLLRRSELHVSLLERFPVPSFLKIPSRSVFARVLIPGLCLACAPVIAAAAVGVPLEPASLLAVLRKRLGPLAAEQLAGAGAM